MKNLFRTDQHSDTADTALLIARLGIGGLMLTHGIPKMSMFFSGEPIQFLPFMGLSAKFSLGLAVFAEVFCSVLLILGLATRLAVIPLIITMFIALTAVHAADPFNKKEPAVLYLLVYLILLIAGSGKFSVDRLLHSKGMSNNDVRLKKTNLAV
jgi:putative oxidoreductase